MERDDTPIERHLADALRRLNAAAIVPPIDEAREAALLAAFDREHTSAPARSEHTAPALSERSEWKRPGLSERSESKARRDYWHLAALAAAAAVLIAVGTVPARSGRHVQRSRETTPATASSGPSASVRDVRREPPNEFVLVPGAAGLPPMESGTLVRVDVPVALLPSYGVTPPAGRATTVTADFVVAQDGLPRAVRVVAP